MMGSSHPKGLCGSMRSCGSGTSRSRCTSSSLEAMARGSARTIRSSRNGRICCRNGCATVGFCRLDLDQNPTLRAALGAYLAAQRPRCGHRKRKRGPGVTSVKAANLATKVLMGVAVALGVCSAYAQQNAAAAPQSGAMVENGRVVIVDDHTT